MNAERAWHRYSSLIPPTPATPIPPAARARFAPAGAAPLGGSREDFGDIDLGGLGRLGMSPLRRLALGLRRWRLQRMIRHYQMCADIEEQQARQAHANAAWFQKQAALARRALALPPD